MRDFVKQGRDEMNDFVRKAINDLLAKLDFPINLPTDRDGIEKDNKLYTVVQSREEVYKNVCDLMDLIKLEESDDQDFKNKIIKGLKTTWHELTKIATRDIGNIEQFMNEDEEELRMSPEEAKIFASKRVTDDIMTSIAKAKFLAAKLSYQILDRIELLENPDAVNDKVLSEQQTSSIAERYVENG